MINDLFNIFLPQANLIVFIFLQLLLSLFVSPRFYKYARLLSVIGISLSTVFLTMVQTEPQYFGFRNTIMSDQFTLLFHFLIFLCGFSVTIITKNLVKNMKQNAYLFHSILLTAILGATLVVSANDFLTLFITVEMLSFSMYFLIAASKGYYTKEAAFKYLITNAVASGVFLFGVSYLYGLTSSINLSDVYEILSEQETSLLVSFSEIMIIFGLISKLAIFPFANWIIDVYKGCETSVLAFLSTIPKIAIFGIICRLLVFGFGNSLELTFIIAIISVVTAFWANTYALKENNVKVIFACSSSANSSYILIAACLVSVYNLSAVIFYLIADVIMNLGVFTFLNMAEANKIGMNTMDYKGIFHKNHVFTVIYAFLVVGLAGLPITSGFIAKIYLFSAIAGSGLIFIPFLILIFLLMVIALYYYLKIVLPLFEENSDITAKLLNLIYSQKIVLTLCAIITLIIGIYPEKLIELCKIIAYNI